MSTSSKFCPLLWIIAFLVMVSCRFEFTNIKCMPLDIKFAEFEDCFMKSINRSYKYLSVKVKLHKVPITNITVRLAMVKRLNGYKPFLYNFTYDACKFLKNPNSNLVWKYFYGFIGQHSNMNHTCPYDHDIIVDKIPISYFNHRLTEVLPVPEGDYAFYTSWLAYGVNRANVNIYFSLS